MGWECSIYGRDERLKILFGRHDAKRPLMKPIYRGKDITIICLR